MPKKNVDYSKTIIYKIVCNDLNVKDIYIGSTSDFTRRKYQHKSNCCCPTQKGYNYKIYQIIRANGGWSNWSMIMVEPYPCNNNLEAVARERYWFEVLNANLNSCKPSNMTGVSMKEYLHQYWQQNAEQIKQKRNVKHTCECGGKYTLANKSHHLKSKQHQNYIISNNIIDGNESTTCQTIQQPCDSQETC